MDIPQPAASPEKDDPTIWRVDDAIWAELEPLLVGVPGSVTDS